MSSTTHVELHQGNEAHRLWFRNGLECSVLRQILPPVGPEWMLPDSPGWTNTEFWKYLQSQTRESRTTSDELQRRQIPQRDEFDEGWLLQHFRWVSWEQKQVPQGLLKRKGQIQELNCHFLSIHFPLWQMESYNVTGREKKSQKWNTLATELLWLFL